MMDSAQDPQVVPSEGTLDLREFFGKVARRKWLVLGVAILVTGLAALYSYSRPSVYTTTAEVLVLPTLVPLSDTDPSDNLSMPTEVQLVTSSEVAQLVRQDIGGSLTVQELLDRISVSNPENTEIVRISFLDPTSAGARQGANAVATAYLAFREDRAIESIDGQVSDIQSEIDLLQAQISVAESDLERASLITQLDNLRNQLADVTTRETDPGEVLRLAPRPTSPVSPKHPLDLALGGLLGLAAGVTLASAREQLRDRIQSPPVLRRALKAPALGMIPRAFMLGGHSTRLVSIDDPRGAAAEAYRTLRTNLLAACREARVKTILVTSAQPREGKTTTAVNLAVALAQVGKSVVLISADLRHPRLHTFFGISNEQGLGQVLRGTVPLNDALVGTRVADLRVLPSGPVTGIDEAVELLQSERMHEVIRRCRQADFVIVDGPPIFPVADSLVLADLVEAVLFVADAREGTRAGVAQSRHQLEQVGGRILGGVLNRAQSAWSSNGYDYRRGFRSRRKYQEIDEDEPSLDTQPGDRRSGTPTRIS